MKKLINSFKYAFEGLFVAIKRERNLKIHIFIMVIVILLGFLLKISEFEWILCIICFAMVIGGELFNTAIETAVDIAMPEKNKKAKVAKDVSASAVLIFAIGAAVIGIIIFIPKIINLI